MAYHSKTGSGSPAGVLTPDFYGQHYIDTGTNSIYVAHGLTSANWTSIVLNGGAAATSASLIDNLEISTSRAGNAETIALKTAAGTDPSASDKIKIGFRDSSAGTGAYSVVDITAATSIVISSGSTLGASNATAFRAWLVGFSDAGTFRLGVIKCALTDGIYGLQDNVLESSTAEGGAGAADSSGVIYTGTAVTSKAMRVLGYLEYTLTTAGTWVTAPSVVQIYSHGDRLPGEMIQVRMNRDGAYSAGAATIPIDNTIPQNTEGTQFMSQAITPKSAINIIDIESVTHCDSPSNDNLTVALFQDATANALASSTKNNGAANYRTACTLGHSISAGTTSATTFKIRAGGSVSAARFNSSGGAAVMGGTLASYIKVTEIMV